jgi:hypothetical protein
MRARFANALSRMIPQEFVENVTIRDDPFCAVVI